MERRKKEHLSRVLNEEYEFQDGLEQTDLDLSILVEDQIAKLRAWNNPANTFFIMLRACYFTTMEIPWRNMRRPKPIQQQNKKGGENSSLK